MTVTYNEYSKDLQRYIAKHSKKSDYKVYTSPFYHNEYHKEYCFEDGSTFYEINNHNYWEEVEIEVHGIKMKTTVLMIRHEYFSTDDATSKYWYERR